jgi:hypothetical protein
VSASAATRGGEIGARDDPVDEPEAACLLGGDALAQVHEFGGDLAADVTHEQGGDHHRPEADLDLGQADADLVVRDHEVARQQKPDATAERVAVQRGDDGLAEVVQIAHDLREAALLGHGSQEAAAGHAPREVAPGAEGLIARPRQHDDPDGVVPFHLGDGSAEVAHETRRERVAARRAVQRDGRDAARRVDIEENFGRGGFGRSGGGRVGGRHGNSGRGGQSGSAAEQARRRP